MPTAINRDYLLKEDPVDLKKYLNTIYRKRWALFSVMAVVMVVVIVKTFTEIPKYRAKVSMMVDVPTGPLAPTITREGIKSVINSGDYITTQQSIFKSTMLARRVKSALNLPVMEDALIQAVNVDVVKNSRLLNLTIDYPDPAMAAKIANAYADAYIEENVESMLFMSKEVLKVLPGEDRKNIEKSTIYGQLKELNKEDAIDSLPTIFSNPVIQRLKSEKLGYETELANLSKRYKEKHPKVIAIKTKLEFAEEAIRTEKVKTLNMIKADLAGRLQINNVRVIDHAEAPKAPISPNKPRDIMSGLILSVLIGLGVIFFMESLDDSVKNKRDVEQGLNLPYLGSFPFLKNNLNKDLENGRFDDVDKNPEAAEAIRGIRTNIIFSAPKEDLKTVLITSTIPQEGKSLLASYLAYSFAKNGVKTLLIDGDTRKPTINKHFGIERSPGLTNLLVEEIRAADVIRPTKYPNLYVMPCGAKTPNPLELLGSEKLSVLIKGLSEEFGKIIIDAPPSLALSDALVLSKISNGVIFVAKSGFISRDVLKKVKERFIVTSSRVLGVVTNFFSMSEHSYYKDKYYHKYYKNYYHPEKKKNLKNRLALSKIPLVE
ncbi:MAG: polysaccharide biosynthesis tyrosine autokinase [Candidatus Omnitrophica bacterium]|nr:polysaccharide biosynthesis tyrosine autokinase [Candidatus Omnitrophota bacterium]